MILTSSPIPSLFYWHWEVPWFISVSHNQKNFRYLDNYLQLSIPPGLIIPAFYSVVYAKYLSIPEHITSYVLAVLNAAGILGRIVPAYLSDSIGRFNLLIPSAFFTGLSCLVIWLFAKSLVSLMVFAVIYGFISGAFVSLVSPCVAQISRIEQMGTRIGVLYTSFSFPWVSLFLCFSLFSSVLGNGDWAVLINNLVLSIPF